MNVSTRPSAVLPDQLSAAAEQGRICALAAKGQRDLQRHAARYPDLFSGRPFDGALFSNIALAIAFGAPWCTAEQLRLTNRAVLWGFALDWRIDYLAKSRADVDRVVAGALAVADGASPDTDDPLGRLLAELRDELAGVPAFAELGDAWRGAVHRTVTAMAREWDWKTARERDGAPLPSFAEYLDNADNLACTVVNVAHWIWTGDAETHRRLDRLVTVSDEVQRVLRLVNDLASYERDLQWGDLNALLLVADRAEVDQRIVELVERCNELLAPLTGGCPLQAAYLARQIGFSSGFYRSTDFWGER
ncbi:terpene synthase [Micromonospora sp. NBC_01655]|uniref:terpene synthase family protein n=1 Tax=Micromonospora sp. NBC_01655 TaxID=2975983 RepID=UPI00224CB8BA|nr:terpene synthase [Micromonospora sp. NBC_01655]MCX4471182.1 terpene synthase [Micromonospora sp. NBC_01655]